jgi:membrane protease YdiL (CAAX protease family)
MRTPTSHHLFPWTIFLLSALTTIGLFFIPAFIIRPFSHQTPGGLAVALATRQRAPWGTLAAAFVCALFAFLLWQSSTRWRKVAISFIMVLVAFSAVMARLNYFEWMFHPVKNPQFEMEAASKLDSGEMILAVHFTPDARAYPIREMAYHHILNDVVGGVPIAVTY